MSDPTLFGPSHPDPKSAARWVNADQQFMPENMGGGKKRGQQIESALTWPFHSSVCF